MSTTANNRTSNEKKRDIHAIIKKFGLDEDNVDIVELFSTLMELKQPTVLSMYIDYSNGGKPDYARDFHVAIQTPNGIMIKKEGTNQNVIEHASNPLHDIIDGCCDLGLMDTIISKSIVVDTPLPQNLHPEIQNEKKRGFDDMMDDNSLMENNIKKTKFGDAYIPEELKHSEKLNNDKNNQDALLEQKKKDALIEQQKQDALLEQKQKQDALIEQKKKDELIKQKKKDELIKQKKKQDALLEQQKKQDALLEQQKKQDALLEQQKKQLNATSLRQDHRLKKKKNWLLFMLYMCGDIESSMKMNENQKIYDILGNSLKNHSFATPYEVDYMRMSQINRNKMYDPENHKEAQDTLFKYGKWFTDILTKSNNLVNCTSDSDGGDITTWNVTKKFITYQKMKKHSNENNIFSTLNAFETFEKFYSRKVLKDPSIIAISDAKKRNTILKLIHAEIPMFFIYHSLRTSINIQNNEYIVDFNQIISIKNNF
jgi:hypothetical protein